MVKPALVKRRFGKGDLLIGLSPTMHRPCYYLVWVDAEWFEDEMHEHLDDIWDGIAEEFGQHESDEDAASYQWPMVDDEGGCHWWQAQVDDILTPRARVKLDRKHAVMPNGPLVS